MQIVQVHSSRSIMSLNVSSDSPCARFPATTDSLWALSSEEKRAAQRRSALVEFGRSAIECDGATAPAPPGVAIMMEKRLWSLSKQKIAERDASERVESPQEKPSVEQLVRECHILLVDLAEDNRKLGIPHNIEAFGEMHAKLSEISRVSGFQKVDANMITAGGVQ